MPRGRSRRSGQALVEFALVLPVFLLLLFGLIDGARFVYMNSVVSQAAREGARLAAAEARYIAVTTTADPSCVANAGADHDGQPGAHVCPATETGATNSLQADITSAANRMVAPFGASHRRTCISLASLAERSRPPAGPLGLFSSISPRREERCMGPSGNAVPTHHTHPRAGLGTDLSGSATMTLN